MKSQKIAISLCLIFTSLVGAGIIMNFSAHGETMTSQQVQQILTNCTSVNNTLNQLHASDALLRVNMGQIYESMSTKLMNGFNGRVSNNGLDNSDLVLVFNSYNLQLDTFRSDYITYEQHLAAAININCQKQPVEFYDAIATARNDRSRVHDDVAKLNQALDSYQTAVSQFGNNYNNTTSKAGK